jgi:class 3 adenylate cyclase
LSRVFGSTHAGLPSSIAALGMMIFSTFRARLILSVFPIVVGITVGVILLSELRFSATYERLFDEKFENLIRGVTEAKNRRFEALAKKLEALASQEAVVAAMKAGEHGRAALLLRPQLEALAQERMQTEGTGPQAKPALPKAGIRAELRPGLSTAVFIALLDAEGNFVLGARPRAPGTAQDAEEPEVRRRSLRMPWLGGQNFKDVLAQQQVGYLLVEAREHRSEQVREVFVTPVRDPAGSALLGAVVFGLPLPALAERTLYEQTRRGIFGEIMGGIYVEGQLVSSTVPEDQKAAVAHVVEEAMQTSFKPRRELLASIAGSQHRVIYRVLNPGSPFPMAAQVSLYSLAPLQAEIRELRRSAVAVGLAALSVALLLIMLVSRSLSGPVSALVAAAREIEQGRYETRVPETADELGKVARSFNEMAAGLALQEKYRSVLNAVADRTVAERLMENPGALGGELRQVTMLFCDIRGFTALTEKMPPHEVIEMLNEHMTALTEVAYAHGGTVDKFVGDLIMVLFGAPEGRPDDPLRAARCAMAMRARRREINRHARQPLEIGIGLATGTVVAGCMGSDRRLNYTVLGSQVNLAARLCSIAQAGEILADASTATALEGILPLVPMPAQHMKGFSAPVLAYKVG